MKERSLLANSAWGISSQVVRGVVGLVFIPIVIAKIGVTGYGLFNIALIFSFYQGLAGQLDMGYPAFLINFISRDKSQLNTPEIASRLNGLNGFLAVANAVMGLVILILSDSVGSAFKVNANDLQAFDQTMFIVLITNFFTIIFISGNAVWMARHQNSYIKKAETVAYFLFVFLAVGFLMIRPSLVSMAAAFFLSQLFLSIRIAWDTKKHWHLTLRPGSLPLFRLKADWPEWKPFLFMKINGFAQRQSDLTFVSLLLGPQFTAVYDISMKVPALIKTLWGRVAEVLSPFASHRRNQENLPYIKTLSENLVALEIAFGVYLTTTIFFFANDLCRIWLGPEHQSIAPTLLSASLISLTYPASSVLLAVLMGQGKRPRQLAWWPTWISIFNIVTTIPATYFFGVQATILLTVLQFAMMSALSIAYARTDFAFSLRVTGTTVLKTVALAVPTLWLGRLWLSPDASASVFWLKFLTLHTAIAIGLLAMHWRQLITTKNLLRNKNQNAFDRTAPETDARI